MLIAATDSVARIGVERAGVAGAIVSEPTLNSLRQVQNPPSLAGAMKKTGVALIAFPDPISGVPGVALLASSYVLKRREPAGLKHLASETADVLRTLQSLRL